MPSIKNKTHRVLPCDMSDGAPIPEAGNQLEDAIYNLRQAFLDHTHPTTGRKRCTKAEANYMTAFEIYWRLDKGLRQEVEDFFVRRRIAELEHRARMETFIHEPRCAFLKGRECNCNPGLP